MRAEAALSHQRVSADKRYPLNVVAGASVQIHGNAKESLIPLAKIRDEMATTEQINEMVEEIKRLRIRLASTEAVQADALQQTANQGAKH